MKYKIPYNGNLKWIQNRTVLLTRHGSHAYGTNIPSSDEDFKGIAIPPKEYFLGGMKIFEQATCNEPDLVIYDIRKFFTLAADCNPNIIEVLWTDESDHMISDDIGREIIDNKEIFISKKAKFTFSGYAMAQMKRINVHYKWLKNPPTQPPTRSEFGLPERTLIPKDQLAAAESQIKKKLDEWTTNFLSDLEPDARIAVENKMAEALVEMQLYGDPKFQAAARTLGYDENFIHLLDIERRYSGRMKEWSNFQEWKKNRNEKRAELESKFGFDTKHAMHLVRLMRMCREILTTGKVVVKRPDREELLAIRYGAWNYEQLVEWVEKEDKELEEVYKNTNVLQKSPDREKIDNLCIKLVEKSLSKYSWYSVKKYFNKLLK